MACPFFMPMQKLEVRSNRPPLPLGGRWQGTCTAPGHEGSRPGDQELKEFCNLGYAKYCRWLPERRAWDAVRFAVSGRGNGAVVLQYVCERNHRPGEYGILMYDVRTSAWSTVHSDKCVQKMAQCYLEAYLERRGTLAT